MKSNGLLKLFLSFFKIGIFTFGGGYAMLPMIEKETVENNKWITNTELLDIFSISQVTPGPIAINAATYIGYKVNGFWGSVFCTLGVVLPSFIIIIKKKQKRYQAKRELLPFVQMLLTPLKLPRR